MGKDKRDWKAIEGEYRAGQLSTREIGRQFKTSESTIRTRAKKEGWKRDLAEQVQAAIRARTLRSNRAPSTREKCVVDEAAKEADDQKIIKRVADRTVKLVQLHKRYARRHFDLIANLHDRLRSLVPVDIEIPLTISEIKEASQIERMQAAAFKSVVAVQREAHGLNDRWRFGGGEGGESSGDDGDKELIVQIINFGPLMVQGQQGHE
jgi:dihydropteroate synthase